MAFWARFWNGLAGIPNDSGAEDYNPGDPEGLQIDRTPVEQRSLPVPFADPWDGWPTGWQTPDWGSIDAATNRLADIAWACLDLSSNIVSSMPVYRLRGGKVMPPLAWMQNPDPLVYTCWQEFAKQLYWDYQMGEAFVLPMTIGSDTYPSSFRVIPPWLVNIEMTGGSRSYRLGGETGTDVTDRILHIRYQGNTADAHGHGPLEVAGARLTSIKLLQRYTTRLAETGGVPLYWMELERRITAGEGQDLIDRWIETRTKNAGHPALVSGGAKLNQAHSMNAKDMALMELSQFNESRIAVLLGLPPALAALAGASGSLTYSNISDLFDFHDRSSLRPKSKMIMESLSGWALPGGQSVELNRDDYTRLPMDKRALVYKTLGPIESGGMGVLSLDEIRTMERFHGTATTSAVLAQTGGID